MKKLLIFGLLLVGCTKGNVEKTGTGYIVSDGVKPLQILTIDSCEYLFGDWGNASVLTHKGNCKNPEHGK